MLEQYHIPGGEIEMYKLSDKVKDSISKILGIPFSQITEMDCKDIGYAIDEMSRKKSTYCKKNDRMLGRVSMYILFGRIISMNKINKEIKKI